MAKWNDLPYDVLLIVFHYLEQDFSTIARPAEYKDNHPKALLQCQLTCKNWAFITRKKIYRDVYIKLRRLESFIRTLQNSDAGPLVKHIYLPGKVKKNEMQDLLVYIRHIATFCTFLKSFRVKTGAFKDIWKVIEEERLKGNFTRLQSVPCLNNASSIHIGDYNKIVFILQQSLRELVVFNNNVLNDDIKQWCFPNLTIVFFRFNGLVDARIINKYIKRLPTVNEINIDIEDNSLDKEQGIESGLDIYPQVKRLYVQQPCRYNNFYSQVRQVFPKLQKMTMIPNKTVHKPVPMSTKEAIQSLECLLRVPEFSARLIPVENIHAVLTDLQGNIGRITKLKLSYSLISPHDPQLLSIETCPYEKDKIIINASCKANTPHMLPHIGLIEQSGESLQYLEICMFPGPFGKQGLQRLKKGATFSSFLQQCPHLRGIRLSNTILHTFGAQFQTPLEIHSYISINSSLIHPSFLPSLSSSVSYISQFSFIKCNFMDERKQASIREIDMPNTKFHNITYVNDRLLHQTYLKLKKAKSDAVYWYISNDFSTLPCTEEEYIKSLTNQIILSLSIQCKDISTLRIRFPNNTIVLKI